MLPSYQIPIMMLEQLYTQYECVVPQQRARSSPMLKLTDHQVSSNWVSPQKSLTMHPQLQFSRLILNFHVNFRQFCPLTCYFRYRQKLHKYIYQWSIICICNSLFTMQIISPLVCSLMNHHNFMSMHTICPLSCSQRA